MRGLNGPTSVRRQALIGMALASLIVTAWLATHIVGLSVFRLDRDPPLLVPVLVALQCWLNVGLFIVAHDAMHGSLAPFRPRLNRAIGRLCLALYAGFSYDRLINKHFAHHRHAGTELDPDFHASGPRRFWPWYLAFFRRYFGLTEFLTLAALLAVYLGMFGVPSANALLFWALPAVLSSLQLFYFGTYLPHRHEDEPFGDRHNARSNNFSWPISLLTCFHFGYHHEHHARPDVPWWQLPGWRQSR
jgi:beta-carotene/zeaxanthin 4-ketolase